MTAVARPPKVAPALEASQAEVPVRGEAAFRALERALLAVEGASRRLVPDAWNPLLQSGAWVTVLLLVACVSGALLLFWYSPSVHQAHESMRAIEAAFVPRVVRALHRYSSDLCVVLLAWHTLRLTAARRFTGPRWLAWVSGVAGLGLVWVVGWLGYWLVWDEPARQVALGTARFLDAVPVFVDPLSREFLSDASINSLLFFIVFFAHMLVPLGIGVAVWLHLARLQRPVFLTPRGVTVAMVAGLLVLSAVLPPVAEAPARMAQVPGAMRVDAWYLLPLVLTERLTGGALWALTLGLGVFGFAVPWLLSRGRNRAATVVESRCNACNQCIDDCPYEAITLVPRTDDRPFKGTAKVDPSRCVGCGICAGSCSSAGSGLPHFGLLEERERTEGWFKRGEATGELLVFVCHDSGPAGFVVDEATGVAPLLPGCRVVKVPCLGWVQAISLERALRFGAAGVLLVGCAGSCRFREGMTWTRARLERTRGVELPQSVDAARVRVVELTRTDGGLLLDAVRAFRAGLPGPPLRRAPRLLGALVTGVVLGGVTWAGSVVPWAPPLPQQPELAVSFKHPGQTEERCRTLSPEEVAKQPPHMRRTQVCERKRADVRLKVAVDGVVVHERAYPPHGLWGDGVAVGVETLSVPEGRHRVELWLDDGLDLSRWAFTDAREVEFRRGDRHAVLFDRLQGFAWHLNDAGR